MSDIVTKQDWCVTEYDEADHIIETWIIESRTEYEAEREAEAQLSSECADWTMMPIEQENV